MSTFARTFVCFALGGSILACAHHSTARNTTQRPNADVITRAEIERSEYASLYEVVQALRGRWLRTRGPNTFLGRPIEVQVMVDDMRLGDVSTLRTLTSDNVVAIAFVDPVTAAQRWGGRFAQGTIVVTTHADGAPVAESRP